MTSSTVPADLPLAGKRVAFVGKLGGLLRREAPQWVRAQGGTLVERPDASVDLIVLGADELPLEGPDFLDAATRQAAAEGRLEIIPETELWQRLGLVESEQAARRLYTPAMLAQLLKVPVSVVRRWHRRGLIVPAREVLRLPYFDFQEVASARRLAQLLAAGASPAIIEKKLADLARFMPHVERPLAQLSVIVEGRQVLLRQGAGLLEPGGQLRFDFEATADTSATPEPPAILSLERQLNARPAAHLSREEILQRAAECEAHELLDEAIELLRTALVVDGPDAEINFQLAELLYRSGDLSAARERYFVTIELDEEFVEARANLGCVLAELGQKELAVAAFEGALAAHEDYPDMHFHLAHTLDELSRADEAEPHWRRFLELAPESPWADQAVVRLQE